MSSTSANAMGIVGKDSAVQFSNTIPKVAFCHHQARDESRKSPCIIYLPGFRSSMFGQKGDFLERFCTEQCLEYVRFDYRAHGQSQGNLANATISDWLADTLWILDHVVQSKKSILVGSSMGGWLSLLAAQRRPNKVCGLALVACAVDMTKYYPAPEYRQVSHTDQQGQIYYQVPNAYDDQEPYLVYESLLQDGEQYYLLDKDSFSLDPGIPVRIMHGEKDELIPTDRAALLLQKLEQHQDATLHVIKDGDHRLSHPEHLEILRQSLLDLLNYSKQ